MGDVIDLSSKFMEKQLKSMTEYERVTECFFHMMSGEDKTCTFCVYRTATARMMFEILMKELLQASKTRNLNLTNVDAEFIIMETLEFLKEFQEKVVEQQKSKAPTNGQGKPERLSAAPWGEPETPQGSETVEETVDKEPEPK